MQYKLWCINWATFWNHSDRGLISPFPKTFNLKRQQVQLFPDRFASCTQVLVKTDTPLVWLNSIHSMWILSHGRSMMNPINCRDRIFPANVAGNCGKTCVIQTTSKYYTLWTVLLRGAASWIGYNQAWEFSGFTPMLIRTWVISNDFSTSGWKQVYTMSLKCFGVRCYSISFAKNSWYYTILYCF